MKKVPSKKILKLHIKVLVQLLTQKISLSSLFYKEKSQLNHAKVMMQMLQDLHQVSK